MTTTIETSESLRRIPIFQGISASDQDALVSITTHKRFEAGDVIFIEGTPSTAIYIVEHGAVEVRKNNKDGTIKVIARLGSGECFGEMSVICDYPHSATLVATQACDVLLLGKPDFQELLLSMPGLATGMLKNLAVRLRGANDHVREFNSVAREIETLSGVVGSIANQTHILAINASIEAARAGDLGRGFGVVAKEMRSLADGSETAVSRIKSLAAQIRNRAQ